MKFSNLAARIVVSLIFIPIIIGVVHFGGYSFLAFVAVLSVAGFIEFSRFGFKADIHTDKFIGIISVLLILLNNYLNFTTDSTILSLSAVVLLTFELYRSKGTPLLNVGATFFGVIYLGMFAGSLIKIREVFQPDELLYNEAGLIVLSIFVTVWVCDSGAYFIGSAFGKHKLMPRVSPKKSWEGAIGGTLLALVGMVAMHQIYLDFISLYHAVIMAAIIAVVGQFGDFVESLLKRNAQLKDSSGIIPGHGGVLDRFDSIFFSAPVVYAYLKFVVV